MTGKEPMMLEVARATRPSSGERVDRPPDEATVDDTAGALGRWTREHAGLPLPGGGRTAERFAALAAVAGKDLALGRLAEGHADAVAILREAGRAPFDGAVYGVWAARSSAGDVAARPVGRGWVLDGEKGFCSGAGLVDRALVTADAPDGPRLFEVDLRAGDIRPRPGTWPAVGMAASASAACVFDDVALAADRAVGDAGFYTGRVGFWWGAAGVAACWWGGAQALVDHLCTSLAGRSIGDHEAAALGTAVARCRSMAETLRWAAEAIDAGRDTDTARYVAQVTREVVHDGAVAVLVGCAAAGGARPICLDGVQSRRSADLYAYLAQHHVGRDAAALGRHVLAEPGVGSGPDGGTGARR
jgi:alkylation response protein AidB-like acyl-CoA dehydrogenase